LQRNLALFLNIAFCLSWIFFASRIADSQNYAAYIKFAAFVIIAAFMLTLLSVMLQKRKFLKVMLFVNRLFAIFLATKLGLNVIASPSAIGAIFILFVVIPFVINSLLLKRIIQPPADEQ